MKPLNAERFNAAINRAKQYLDIREKAANIEPGGTENSIFVRSGYDSVKVILQDILYLEALKDYTRIATEVKHYYVLCPISHLLKEKKFESFIRIHRSYAVQKQLIKKITPYEVITNTISIPIGRTYKDALRMIQL